MQDTIQIQPNATRAIPVSGKFVAIVSCTAAFKLEMDRGGQNTAVTGSIFSQGSGFARLTFTDTSGAVNTVVYDVSENAPSPSRQTNTANISTITGTNSGAYSFPLPPPKSNYTLDFGGTDTAGRTRKVFYVQVTGANPVTIKINGNAVASVPADGKPYPFEVQDSVNVSTANLATSFNWWEIFYAKPLLTDQS